jgi:hypothetical protein
MRAGVGASVSLSRIVDISQCSPSQRILGMCPPEWLDRKASVKLCGHYHGIGMREDARGMMFRLFRVQRTML